MNDSNSKPHFVNPDQLLPHPLNARVYGPENLEPDFVESIRLNGVQEPVTVVEAAIENEAGLYILSGHRRVAAAKRIGRTVPIRVIEDAGLLWSESFLLESNRQRVKSEVQLMREATERLRIAGALAEEREKAGIKVDPSVKSGKGRASAIVGERIGRGEQWVEKAAVIVRRADEGDPVAIEGLKKIANKEDGGSVNAVHKSLKAKKSEKKTKPVELTDDEFDLAISELRDAPEKIRNLFQNSIHWFAIPTKPKRVKNGVFKMTLTLNARTSTRPPTTNKAAEPSVASVSDDVLQRLQYAAELCALELHVEPDAGPDEVETAFKRSVNGVHPSSKKYAQCVQNRDGLLALQTEIAKLHTRVLEQAPEPSSVATPTPSAAPALSKKKASDLTLENRHYIYEQNTLGCDTQKTLAEKFGVSRTTISNVVCQEREKAKSSKVLVRK